MFFCIRSEIQTLPFPVLLLSVTFEFNKIPFWFLATLDMFWFEVQGKGKRKIKYQILQLFIYLIVFQKKYIIYYDVIDILSRF
jgi:hypothetical protein